MRASDGAIGPRDQPESESRREQPQRDSLNYITGDRELSLPVLL